MTRLKPKLLLYLVLGLTFYLLFFSAFALFHAYANDELADTHGCQIGLWVQHGQTLTFAVLLFSTVLACFLYRFRFDDLFDQGSLIQRLTTRAPPLFSHP
jgi:hypothetical protein